MNNRNEHHDGDVNGVFGDSGESLLMQIVFWEDFLECRVLEQP